MHMQVSPKEEVLSRPLKPVVIPLDVALIMFDSTSAANFKRKMPNTLEYLTKHLNSVLLQGLFYFMIVSLCHCGRCGCLVVSTADSGWRGPGWAEP